MTDLLLYPIDLVRCLSSDRERFLGGLVVLVFLLPHYHAVCPVPTLQLHVWTVTATSHGGGRPSTAVGHLR